MGSLQCPFNPPSLALSYEAGKLAFVATNFSSPDDGYVIVSLIEGGDGGPDVFKQRFDAPVKPGGVIATPLRKPFLLHHPHWVVALLRSRSCLTVYG